MTTDLTEAMSIANGGFQDVTAFITSIQEYASKKAKDVIVRKGKLRYNRYHEELTHDALVYVFEVVVGDRFPAFTSLATFKRKLDVTLYNGIYRAFKDLRPASLGQPEYMPEVPPLLDDTTAEILQFLRERVRVSPSEGAPTLIEIINGVRENVNTYTSDDFYVQHVAALVRLFLVSEKTDPMGFIARHAFFKS